MLHVSRARYSRTVRPALNSQNTHLYLHLYIYMHIYIVLEGALQAPKQQALVNVRETLQEALSWVVPAASAAAAEVAVAPPCLQAVTYP